MNPVLLAYICGFIVFGVGVGVRRGFADASRRWFDGDVMIADCVMLVCWPLVAVVVAVCLPVAGPYLLIRRLYRDAG